MFLTIKPGKPEEIRIQLQRLHSFLNTLDLDEATIGGLIGIPLSQFLSSGSGLVSPYTVKEYFSSPSEPDYYGAAVLASRELKQKGLLLVNLLCGLKKATGQSRFPEYMKEAQIFAESLQLGKATDSGAESSNRDEYLEDLRKSIAEEVQSTRSKILFLLDQKPRTAELGTYPGTNILLMEELENQFAWAAVKYHHQFSEDWENYKFNPSYFDNYIPEVLFPEFREYCQNTLGPLNDYVRSKIFENSMIQFGRTKPEERRARIFAQYVKYYWEPNPPLPPGDMELGYLYQIFQSYVKHFHLFKDLINDLAVHFSRIHNTEHPLHSFPKPESLKPKTLSFDYIHKAKNPEAINELFKDLKDLGLLHPESSIYDFRRAFTNGNPEKSIRWTGSISELHFFIKCIHNQEKKVVNLKQKHWEVAQLCFVDTQGNRFDRNKLKNQKDPVSADSIRNLIQNL